MPTSARLPDFKIAWAAWSNPNNDANNHGYAHVGHKLFENIAKKPGILPHNMYFDSWDALVCVSTPAVFLLGPGKEKRPDVVFHTMFEAHPLPDGWVDNLNRAGLIWTPTNYWADQFRAQGVTTPIMVAGYGVDTKTYTYFDRSNRRSSRPFKVLIWSELPISRKNVMASVAAFKRANLPNAVLEIKVMEFPGWSKETEITIDGECVPLKMHVGSWKRDRLVRWLQSGDVGLYLSGGEGFGLMPMEMMATGLPVICAANTGMLEYLDDRVNAYCVPCREMRDVPSYQAAYGYKAQMAYPDVSVASELLRECYENRRAAYKLGTRAAEIVREEWTWEIAAESAVTQLRRHFGKL